MIDSGPGFAKLFKDDCAQAMRSLVNEIEATLAGLLNYASRAQAVSTGHVFDSSDGIASIAAARQILSDNGAPKDDLQLVLDTGFAASLRSLSVLYKANEAGTDQMLREGVWS